jgi:hypothetical protein
MIDWRKIAGGSSMAQEREARPAEQADSQRADDQQTGGSRDGREHPGNEPPQAPSVNQVRDEPFPASHDDDGRPEPGEESSAPGTRGGRG